jgi:hypothetical protein
MRRGALRGWVMPRREEELRSDEAKHRAPRLQQSVPRSLAMQAKEQLARGEASDQATRRRRTSRPMAPSRPRQALEASGTAVSVNAWEEERP